jgi:hypothetical protein
MPQSGSLWQLVWCSAGTQMSMNTYTHSHTYPRTECVYHTRLMLCRYTDVNAYILTYIHIRKGRMSLSYSSGAVQVTNTHTHVFTWSYVVCVCGTGVFKTPEGDFHGFQRFFCSKPVLKAVENRFPALNYFENASMCRPLPRLIASFDAMHVYVYVWLGTNILTMCTSNCSFVHFFCLISIHIYLWCGYTYAYHVRTHVLLMWDTCTYDVGHMFLWCGTHVLTMCESICSFAHFFDPFSFWFCNCVYVHLWRVYVCVCVD